MSKILFWSPFHGQGQTSNLHVTAFVMGLLYKKRVLMMQTHFTGNNMESPFIGQNVEKKERVWNELFHDVGLDVAVMYSNMNMLNQETLENCCFTFPNTSLLLLPGTAMKNRESFDRDIGKAVNRMIYNADECMDMVLIDSNSGDDPLSFLLMKSSDLIIVNLTQHRYVLEKFFSYYLERIPDKNKLFYLFGDYDDNSSYNINNCRRKYHKYIHHNNSGVIPYCTKFLDAQNDSDIVRFMKNGLRHKGRSSIKFRNHLTKTLFTERYAADETDYLFHRSGLAVEKMLKKLHKSPEREFQECDKG